MFSHKSSQTNGRWLELRIPPPIVALLVGVLMWLVPPLVAPMEVPPAARVGIAVAVASVGLGLGLSGMAAFRRAKTTMNPTRPSATSALVTGGAFRFTRNPMYLSLVLYLLAWGVYLSNWLALLFLPVFALYITQFQIRPEERVLFSLFGQEYAAYRERVRRWL